MLEMLFGFYRWIFARRFFYRFNVLLHRLSLGGLGFFNYENQTVSGELHFLQTFIKPRRNVIVFDVGANQGDWSRSVLAVDPGARLYAFEPHPKSFRSLQEMDSIVALNFACGSRSGEFTLYDRKDSDGSKHASLFEEAITANKGWNPIEHKVQVIRLDDFVEKQKISHVDLLKIDAEGSEFDVLTGAADLIRRGLIEAIQFEFDEMNVYSRVFMNDFFNLLKEYDFFRLLPKCFIPIRRYTPLSEIFAHQNVVAIRKDTDTQR